MKAAAKDRKGYCFISACVDVTQINTLGIMNLKKDETVRSGDF